MERNGGSNVMNDQECCSPFIERKGGGSGVMKDEEYLLRFAPRE